MKLLFLFQWLSIFFNTQIKEPLPPPKHDSKQDINSIVGIWFNQERSSKIEIFRTGDKFYGKIIWLAVPLDAKTHLPRIDIFNPQKTLKNRPVLGLIILKDFIYTGENVWEDGTVYDPRNGKNYSGLIGLDPSNNDKLNLTGYLMFSFIGRTNVWTRVK